MTQTPQSKADQYIKKIAPRSRLSGARVEQLCRKHNIDVCFVLAQAQIESSFGTAGKAKYTNSVWNVMGHHYSHPNYSIEPYILLLKEKYLGDSKTHYHLLDNYVSLAGNRYAADKRYENKLKKTYESIKRCIRT